MRKYLVTDCSSHPTSVCKVNLELRNRHKVFMFHLTSDWGLTFLLLGLRQKLCTCSPRGGGVFTGLVAHNYHKTFSLEPTSLAMSVYFCFSFGSRTAHQSASIFVAPRLSSLGCSWRTTERWRLQNKRNAFIGLRARCSGDSSSSVSPTSCSRPLAPRSWTYRPPKQKPDV